MMYQKIIKARFYFYSAANCYFVAKNWCIKYSMKMFHAILHQCYKKNLMGMLRYGCNIGFLYYGNKNKINLAEENFRCLTGGMPRHSLSWTQIQRVILEDAATWGRNKKILEEIQQCAEQLNHIVSGLRQQGRNVILAPLHIVSDIIAGMVASHVAPRISTIIVSSGAEKFREVCRTNENARLYFCSIHQDNIAFSRQLSAVINDVIEGKQNIIIFPDIPPTYTSMVSALGRNKIKCKLFGRPAKLHDGILRLSKIMSASVLFFYIYYDDGLKIKIYSPVESENIAVKAPEIIEESIREHPEQWTLWHNGFLFF
ncbi:TPA: ABC transporter [Escherichia coli]|nr:ABC transporter [Escherichia coli]EFH7982081.1 ABC transporter [Escherichia coli]EFL4103858.1 ABC transporter [Escherichia coli]EFM0028150.1 ABC transporter [Escherichia coli]EFO4443811.1 ABC transporter [Escherichia coli]